MCSLSKEGERVVEGLEEVLVVLDHLAAHVNAKPLLVAVQLIASTSLSGRSRCAMSPAKYMAHSKPSEIDSKYGDPRVPRGRRALVHFRIHRIHGCPYALPA